MRNIRLYFNIFVIFLLLFFWETAKFWYSGRYSDDATSGGISMYGSLVMVEVMSLYLMATSPKFKCQHSRISLLCFLWEMVMLVVLIFNETAYSQWYKCLAWPLFFQASYLFIRTDSRLVKSFRKIFYGLAVLGGVYLILSLQYKDFESQTNMVYFFLLTFPILLLTPKKRQRYFLLILSTFVAFLSMKRSMILSFGLFWGFIEIKYLLSKGKKTYAVILSVVMAVVIYGSFNVANDITEGHLSERLNTGDEEDEDITNGREAIYLTTSEMIKSSPVAHQILGNGHNAVRRDSVLEISAHNEFLEIIYDYGIITLLVYIGFWLYILRQWYFHYRNNTVFFMPYTMSVCIFAVMAMVSQLVLYGSYFLYLVIFWGMVAALRDRQESGISKPKGRLLTKKLSSQK